MKILCFGSLNIDYTYEVDHFVRKGETLSSRSLSVFPGGKGNNQAIALSKAGARTLMAGAIGEDGRFLLKLQEEAGVDASLVSVLSGEKTGHAIIQRDPEGSNCILLHGGANRQITGEMVAAAMEGMEEGDYVLLQNEINANEMILQAAEKRGLKVALTPSPMNEEIRKLPLEKVSLFLVNEVEAAQILGEELPEDFDGLQVCLRLQEKYPGADIILTLGSRGSVCVLDGVTVRQPVYPVKAVDTTGAGDTFTGFVLASLLRGERPEAAMDLASRGASIAVSRPGAASSIPALAEVMAQYEGEKK